MDAGKFEWWLQNCLLPNLEEPTLIILDNASCHSRLDNPAPTPGWSKAQLLDYLTKFNIEHKKNLLRSELLELAMESSAPKTYVIDEIIATNGHKILRLPPYHSHFNAIEMVWSQCKSYFEAHIGEDGYGHNKVIEMWEKSINLVTKTQWEGYVNHTEKVMNDWWNRELALDNTDVEQIFINLTNDSDSSDSDSDI